MKVHLKFKDGSKMKCKIIADVLFVLLVKEDNYYYLIDKSSLEDDGIKPIENEN